MKFEFKEMINQDLFDWLNNYVDWIEYIEKIIDWEIFYKEVVFDTEYIYRDLYKTELKFLTDLLGINHYSIEFKEFKNYLIKV